MRTKKNAFLAATILSASLACVLLVGFRGSAQSGNACLDCDTSRFSCNTACEVAENNCLDNPESDRFTCAMQRAECGAACESTWSSCRDQNCGPTAPGSDGGNSSGKDPDCVNYCDELEGACLDGNPLDPYAYDECINSGASPSDCCRAQRASCVNACPPCEYRVNCPKNP